MAKGAQDWVARTDILLQTLSELVIRNKYGALQTYWYHGFLLSTGEHTLLSISGKGIIFGGSAFTSGEKACEDDSVLLEVDGNETIYTSYSTLLARNFTKPNQSFYYLTEFNLVNNTFTMQILGRITFENSLKLKYYNNYAGPYLSLPLYYATI